MFLGISSWASRVRRDAELTTEKRNPVPDQRKNSREGLRESQELNFNVTKSNLLEFRTSKNSQIQFLSKNHSLEDISEKFKENSQNITNLQSEQQSEAKLRPELRNSANNQTQGELYQLDFDQISHRLATNENSKIKDFIDTNNFSCIKSGVGQENLKNFLEESKLDSFIQQITNFPNESLSLRNKL